MELYDLILAKKLSGGGGGGDVTVESLSVTSNGTYTAPTGKAYSPVVANVPNTYSAGDEGKVVSSGALVAQSSATYDTNNTYDTTLINSVTVNVSGGGSGFELIASDEFEVSTTSTAAISVGTVTIPSGKITDKKIVYVIIRDKAAPRANHFYGSDSICYSYMSLSSGLNTSPAVRLRIVCNATGSISIIGESSTTKNGVYVDTIDPTSVVIKAKYNSSNSLTIDGTFEVNVYTADFPNNSAPVPVS